MALTQHPLLPKEQPKGVISLLPVNSRAAMIAIACVVGCAELSYIVSNFSALPVYLKYSMGLHEFTITVIGTAFLLCEGVMKGPFGIIGDRIGRKPLIIGGPLVSVVTALLTLVVPHNLWYIFILLKILDGLGAAALWTSALAMIADVVSEDRRSQAMSLFNVTYLLGVAIGPLIGGAANDLTRIILPRVDPYSASFYVISVLFLMTALVAMWRLPNIPPHHLHKGAEFNPAILIQSLKKIPQTLIMAFTTFLGIGLCMLIIKLFAMAEFGVSETEYGSLLLVPALVIGCASVPLGTIGDKIGKAKAVRLGIGLCAVSMWTLIFIKSQLALVLGGSIIGVGFVIAFPAWMALVSSSCCPSQRGAVMGSVGTAQGLGAMIGAPLGGYLYEHAHISLKWLPWVNSHYVPFIGCALLLLISWTIALLTIREPKEAEEQHSPPELS